MNPLRRAITISVVALGLGVSAMSSTAFAHDVPNEKNWHIHDGLGPGPGGNPPSHHAPLAFFPDLFAQEGLDYGTPEAPFVSCPNATDKVFLPNGANGAVIAAGVCISDEWIVHLRVGTDAPASWSTLTGTQLHYLLTPPDKTA
jgi:hypothetical protein